MSPFGLAAWGLDWQGGGVLFNHAGYWTHSREMRDWGICTRRQALGRRQWRLWRKPDGALRRQIWRRGYNHQPMQVHPGQGMNTGGRGFGGPQRPLGGSPQGFAGQQRSFGGREGFGGPARPEMPREQAYGRLPRQEFGGRGNMAAPWAPARPQQFRSEPPPYLAEANLGRVARVLARDAVRGYGGGFAPAGRRICGKAWHPPRRVFTRSQRRG